MELGKIFQEFKNIGDSINDRFNSIADKFKDKDAQIESINTSLKDVNKKLQTSDTNITTNKTSLDEMSIEVLSLIKNLETSTNIKVGQLSKENESLKKQLEEQGNDNSAITNMKKESNRAISSLNTVIDNQKKEINKLSSTIHELQEDIININRTISKLDVVGNVKRLDDNINSINSDIEEVNLNKASTKRVTSDIDLINSKLEDSNKAFTNLLDRVNTVTLDKKRLLKALQEDGNINLEYNIVLRPRVLPRKAIEGTVLIDAKDKRLKYFSDNQWK